MNAPSLSCASINLSNLGEWSNPIQIDNLINSIIHQLDLPDIIAVQEIGGQDTNTDEPIDAHIAKIICQRLTKANKYQYYYIDHPPLPNTTGGQENFNIRCGFFYNEKITVLQLISIGKNQPEFEGCIELEFKASRYPLALQFKYQDKSCWIINCHLKSMNAPTNREKKIAKRQRNQQAQTIKNFIQYITDFPIVIAGDMNDTPNSKTIQTLTTSDFNSIWTNESHACYSYKYHGKPVVLDYILFNNQINLLAQKVLHLNTSTTYEAKFSDHDPLLITFTLL